MKTKFLLALLLAVVLVGGTLVFRELKKNPGERNPLNQTEEEFAPTGGSSVAPIASPTAPANRLPTTAPSARPELWKSFQERFGAELQPEFGFNGCLASIKGKPGQGQRSGTTFDPAEPQNAINRAKEILEAAKDLLCVQANQPFEEPFAKGDAASAQVFFRQRIQGVAIAPFGNLTIGLGPQGELLSLYSDYVADITVTNQPRLGVDDTRPAAVASAAEVASSGNLRAEGGSHVIWVPQLTSNGGIIEGRHAYDFNVQGYEVVVDAETGKVIVRRDRRIQ